MKFIEWRARASGVWACKGTRDENRGAEFGRVPSLKGHETSRGSGCGETGSLGAE